MAVFPKPCFLEHRQSYQACWKRGARWSSKSAYCWVEQVSPMQDLSEPLKATVYQGISESHHFPDLQKISNECLFYTKHRAWGRILEEGRQNVSGCCPMDVETDIKLRSPLILLHLYASVKAPKKRQGVTGGLPQAGGSLRRYPREQTFKLNLRLSRKEKEEDHFWHHKLKSVSGEI